MPKKSNYPDWVLVHKKKGTYINRSHGKYYLYAAHSERVKGTNKVKLIHDGYLGRITEEEGFIPVKDKVEGDVIVYEYGYSHLLVQLGDNVRSAFKRTFKSKGDYVFVCAVLLAIYGNYSEETFECDYIRIEHGRLDLSIAPTVEQRAEIERGAMMLNSLMDSAFDDANATVSTLKSIHKIKINKKFYTSKLPTLSEKLSPYFGEEV